MQSAVANRRIGLPSPASGTVSRVDARFGLLAYEGVGPARLADCAHLPKSRFDGNGAAQAK